MAGDEGGRGLIQKRENKGMVSGKKSSRGEIKKK
jgi:hypothetical protein